MSNAKSANKRLALFIGLLILGAISIIAFLSFTGNENQIFNDVVIEYTALDGSNKTSDKNIFYIFSIIGALIYSLFFFFRRMYLSNDVVKEYKQVDYLVLILSVSLCTNLIFYKKVSLFVLLLFTVVITATVIKKNLQVISAIFAILTVYALLGIYRLLVFIKWNKDISQLTLMIATFVITLAMDILAKEKKQMIRGILVLQLLIPFALLIYLESSYIYQGEIINIHIPRRIQAFVWLVIIAFIAEAVLRFKKEWKDGEELQNVIGFGPIITIMAFNRFSGTGSIVSGDLHHIYENVIGYSQIFELGQKPFEEYIPISGLYSVVHGAIFAFFGKGLASYYFVSTNIFYLIIIALIVFLLKKQMEIEWVLVVAMIFKVTDYNRVALILPIILLLTWPKLMEKKNEWLMAWFLTSFIHALYYPVFGAAVCACFLPLGIWQISTYAKSGQLAKDIRTYKFWIGWGLCLIPVIIGLKLLLGTAKHMLAMGSQTIYADGISRFGQMVPSFFLPYVNSMPLRLIGYYLLTYIVLIAIVWVFVALFCYGKNKSADNAYLSLGAGLMMLVGFSYTVVRLDYNELYARSDGLVRAAFVVLIILIPRFAMKYNKNVLWILGFSVFITSVISGEAFNSLEDEGKLTSAYTVSENYVYANTESPRLGECFVEASTYEYVMRINNNVDQYWETENTSYLGLVDSFGLYYLCDIKGNGAMEILNTIKGYGATEEAIDYLERNAASVGININTAKNYYLYHWLLTSGEYIFDNNLRMFIPNDGSKTKEEILLENKYIQINNDNMSLGRAAGSLGKSMETLEGIFNNKNNSYQININDNVATVSFENAFDGDEADYLYLDMDVAEQDYDYILYDYHNPIVQNADDYGVIKSLLKKNYSTGKTVTVLWTDEMGQNHQIECDLDEGKLLIPVGAGCGWLLNSHSEINIIIKDGEDIITIPEIKEVKLLKLREVQ